MAEILSDGTIRTSVGRVIAPGENVSVEDVPELVELFAPKPRGWPGGFPFSRGGSGGPPGRNGSQGPQGPQGPGIGAQGAQGAQGSAGSAGTPGAQGAQGTIGAQGASGADIYAATRIVSASGDGTDTTIAAAIAALPSSGGLILVKQGTYSISSTVTLPDKDVVIRGCGEGATIVDIGSNVIPAFTIPNGLTAQRTYTFEDLRITGAAVANQRGWSVQDNNKRGILIVNRCETYEVQRIFEVAHSGSTFDSTFITATDCFFQQVTGNTSVLVANSPSYKQVQLTMDRVRFDRTYDGTVVGQLAQGGLFTNFTNVNIVAVDSVFAIGAVDFNVGALNLTACEIYNNAPISNFVIGVASDNDAIIEDSISGCNIAFQDFELAGTGLKFSGCTFDSCSFNDTSISSWANCYFTGIGNAPSTALVTGVSESIFTGCYFSDGTAGSSYVLEDPFIVDGCYFKVGGPSATINCNGQSLMVTGNLINGSVPLLESASGGSRIANNNFTGGFPTLTGTGSIIDDRTIRTVSTSPVTLNQDDRTILVDASGGARTVNLPTAASAAKHVYTIKKIDATGNAVNVTPNGAETIDGAGGATAITVQWNRISIQSDGTAWFRID